MQNNPMLKQRLTETQNQALDPLEDANDESKAVMSKEDAFKVLKRMEEDKMTSLKYLMEQAEQEMWTQHQQQLKMQVERTKCLDRLFLEQGITEQDMGRAMREHKTSEDPEFLAF